MTLTGLIVAGLIGTAVMTAFMFMGKSMGMMPPDFNLIMDGLGGKLKPMFGLSTGAMGMVAHYIMGTLVLPLLYFYVWIDLGILSGVLSAIVFVMIFGVLMILMLGYLGAPSEYRMKMAMGIVMGHLAYALILFYVGDLF